MENDQKYLTENREKFNNDLLDFISTFDCCSARTF